MTHDTCRLTAKNRDQLRNPTLGNRVWLTVFNTFLRPIIPSGSGTFRIVFWVETIRASIPGARGGVLAELIQRSDKYHFNMSMNVEIRQ